MGYRHFPAPRAPRGSAGDPCPVQSCSGYLTDWDCGCAWGCDLCWVFYACSRCDKKIKGPPAPSRYPRPAPVKGIATTHGPRGKPLQQCPHCGAKKVGLADHIRDRHGPGNRTPAPTQQTLQAVKLDCPDCGSPMKLKESQYGLFYGCAQWSKTGCKGSHGAHPNGMPLGIPADSRTKKMRMAAHNSLDPLWKGPDPVFESRERAYRWMQSVLSMTEAEAHIGKFDSDQCAALIEHIWDAFGEDEVKA